MSTHQAAGATNSPPPQYNRQNEDQPNLVSLHDVLGIISQNWITLFGMPLAFALLALYWALAQDPRYKATALLQLDPKPSQAIGRSEELYDPGYESLQYYGTQLAILESRKLAENLVERLDLTTNVEFGGAPERTAGLLARLLSLLPGMPDAPIAEPIALDERRELAIQNVLDAAEAELAPSTTLFRVSFRSEDPDLAATGANALADLYIEELLQSRLDVYAKATLWLTEKLSGVETELSSAESQLQEFRDDRSIVKIGDNRRLLEEDLSAMTERLRDASQTRTDLQNSYREVLRLTDSGTNLAEARPFLRDEVIQDTANNLRTANANLREIEQRYGSRHPSYLSAKVRVDSLTAEYKELLASQARSLKSRLDIAAQSENQLRAQVRTAENRLRELDQAEFQLSMLERNVSSNRQLYDLFLSRFKETESRATFNEANARIADPAVTPQEPFSPNKLRYLLIGAVIGAILAVLVITLRELLRARIETADDIESITLLPLLGIVPLVRGGKLKKAVATYLHGDPKSAFADSVRSIKTAIAIGAGSNRAVQVLALSSTEPGEGKTTITASLGCVLAAHAKVLLIDCDMRRPRLHRQFAIDRQRSQGIADVLQDTATVESVLQRDPASGLDLIPAGTPPANPALLLDSQRLRELLRWARDNYEYVLIDNPPLLATSDALHMADAVDQFIILTRAERTHRKAFAGALKRLEMAKAPCLGVIMNGATMARSRYQGYYYYGSQYRY